MPTKNNITKIVTYVPVENAEPLLAPNWDEAKTTPTHNQKAPEKEALLLPNWGK